MFGLPSLIHCWIHMKWLLNEERTSSSSSTKRNDPETIRNYPFQNCMPGQQCVGRVACKIAIFPLRIFNFCCLQAVCSLCKFVDSAIQKRGTHWIAWLHAINSWIFSLEQKQHHKPDNTIRKGMPSVFWQPKFKWFVEKFEFVYP